MGRKLFYRNFTPVFTQLLNWLKRKGQRMRRHNNSPLKKDLIKKNTTVVVQQNPHQRRKEILRQPYLLGKLSADNLFSELEFVRGRLVYCQLEGFKELHCLLETPEKPTCQVLTTQTGKTHKKLNLINR